MERRLGISVKRRRSVVCSHCLVHIDFVLLLAHNASLKQFTDKGIGDRVFYVALLGAGANKKMSARKIQAGINDRIVD